MSSQEKTIGKDSVGADGAGCGGSRQLRTVRVDEFRCAGHARCMEEAPEVFGYDSKTNKAFILPAADVNAHPEAVMRAVRGCPEFALRWDDGSQTESE